MQRIRLKENFFLHYNCETNMTRRYACAKRTGNNNSFSTRLTKVPRCYTCHGTLFMFDAGRNTLSVYSREMKHGTTMFVIPFDLNFAKLYFSKFRRGKCRKNITVCNMKRYTISERHSNVRTTSGSISRNEDRAYSHVVAVPPRVYTRLSHCANK